MKTNTVAGWEAPGPGLPALIIPVEPITLGEPMPVSEARRDLASVAGLVLCGGQSKRMGRPKALLPFAGGTLLEHVVRRLQESLGPRSTVMVVAAQGQELPELPAHVGLVQDTVPGRGPLEGFRSGLSQVPHDYPFVYACATDAPFLAPGWIARLLAEIGGSDAAVVVDARQRPQPLAALYRRNETLRAAELLIQQGERRLVALVDRLEPHRMPADSMRECDPDLQTLWNLNTTSDYEHALALLRSLAARRETGFG